MSIFFWYDLYKGGYKKSGGNTCDELSLDRQHQKSADENHSPVLAWALLPLLIKKFILINQLNGLPLHVKSLIIFLLCDTVQTCMENEIACVTPFNSHLPLHFRPWPKIPLPSVTVLRSSKSPVQLSHVRLFATHGPQHARPPCPSPTPRVYSNSCPSSQWCHPTVSSSVIPFLTESSIRVWSLSILHNPKDV